MKRVTLLDVAKHAGVSRATASLVVRDSPLVGAATRAKVEAAMAEVMERLGSQLGSFMSAMQEFQDNSARNVATTRDQLSTLQTEAARTTVACRKRERRGYG